MAFNKDKVLDAARKFVDKGQIDKAVKEYLRVVHEDPKDVRVWLKIGDLYAKKGAKQEAIETYLKVARFYHEQGFFLKAVAVYKQILKLDPRLVDVILKLAELYRQLGLMSDAMQHFESVAAHFHREGNTKEALETVKKLVDLDPENIATRIKLAELYSKEGIVEDAAKEFEVACEQLRKQNRQDDFVKVAERLLWHKPDNHALNRELASLYLRRNDPRRALQKLQACFKADPRDVETLGLLAQAFQALDQKAKTVSVLKELARVHTENKAKDKASEVFRKILEFIPNDPDALAGLGMSAPPAAPPPLPRTQTPQAPPPRAATPMPQAIRAASDARFNLTTDVPVIGPASQRMTGSMPLVDEESLSGQDFALPEYDDADFSADMEPPPDPRKLSAAGERHAEEISKILAETDVYVKYGLHQKAVDHLRRVFSLDAENVEAHERLKDIFISQGREQEAEAELLKLAELIAPSDPDRAEAYLQDLLAMNGTHTGAFELARRFRLRVARMSSVSSEVQYHGGSVAAIDGDLDELELSNPPPAPAYMGVARIQPRAQGSPAQARMPAPQMHGEEPFELDLDPHGQETRQIDERMLEAQLDDDALGHDIDHEVAAEMAASELAPGDDMPFDPDEARAFDHGMGNGQPAYNNGGYPPQAQGYDEALDINGSYDPYGTASLQTPAYGDNTANVNIDATNLNAPDLGASPRAESMVEDDLDEADFYVGQGMYQEALDVLGNLVQRFPNNRMIRAKLDEIQNMMSGGGATAGGGTDAIELEELEELDEIEPVMAAPESKKRGPTVMLEKPVEEGDADTHYDLGLAYKEMGLHDEAIKEFEKALGSTREVQSRVMIAMCLRDSGAGPDAIQQLKAALHAGPNEREAQSIYYEIANTYEAIGDEAEALYYFEAVLKRDMNFADAYQRAEGLRARVGRGRRPADDDL